MTDDITNVMLLEHMQAMKGDLQSQIKNLDVKMTRFQEETRRGFEETRKGFEDARLHRQALQEDLDASIKMLAKHDAKLARF